MLILVKFLITFKQDNTKFIAMIVQCFYKMNRSQF